MIGMPFDFPGEGLSPHPAETATAVAGLVTSGHASQLLLSHDLFLKSMLRKHGGNGFSYVPLAFAARLVRAGVDPPASVRIDARQPEVALRAGRERKQKQSWVNEY